MVLRLNLAVPFRARKGDILLRFRAAESAHEIDDKAYQQN
jgi:hypothetical protein